MFKFFGCGNTEAEAAATVAELNNCTVSETVWLQKGSQDNFVEVKHNEGRNGTGDRGMIADSSKQIEYYARNLNGSTWNK